MLFGSTTSASPGLTDAQRQARRDRIAKAATKIWGHTKDQAKVEKFLENQGLVILSSPGPSIMSSGCCDVDLPGPTLSYDPSLGEYYIYYNWAWYRDSSGNPKWKPDMPFSFVTANVGGPDVWALHLDKSGILELKSQFLEGYDNMGSLTAWGTNPLWNSGDNGVAIEFQDQYIPSTSGAAFDRYTSDHGSFTAWFTKVGKGTLNIRSRWAHTWSNTSITEGTFSNTGLSITFGSTSNRWDIAGRTTLSYNFN